MSGEPQERGVEQKRTEAQPVLRNAANAPLSPTNSACDNERRHAPAGDAHRLDSANSKSGGNHRLIGTQAAAATRLGALHGDLGVRRPQIPSAVFID